MGVSLVEAAEIITAGGVIVYPTETLYAVGCHYAHKGAVEQVFQVKNRDVAKPLPLIVGSWEQVGRFTLANEAVTSVASMFWPGPLSVLVTMQGTIASGLKDAQGRTSLRVTPHPVARALCRLVDAPLVATSANMSGEPAPCRLEDVDPQLMARVDGVVDALPFPQGGEPSTLIEVISATKVKILRHGAIATARFAANGIQYKKLNPVQREWGRV
ncbi:MAG: threonylcarbamoyl-AMP synthase [Deltaproteobacteria bacterium]|nr:MAG: threonylcarbamoyl-AMP synthase [Deltaproteobacteria bacterium]